MLSRWSSTCTHVHVAMLSRTVYRNKEMVQLTCIVLKMGGGGLCM